MFNGVSGWPKGDGAGNPRTRDCSTRKSLGGKKGKSTMSMNEP